MWIYFHPLPWRLNRQFEKSCFFIPGKFLELFSSVIFSLHFLCSVILELPLFRYWTFWTSLYLSHLFIASLFIFLLYFLRFCQLYQFIFNFTWNFLLYYDYFNIQELISALWLLLLKTFIGSNSCVMTVISYNIFSIFESLEIFTIGFSFFSCIVFMFSSLLFWLVGFGFYLSY